MNKRTNIKEIIVTGAESSGKTTLSRALSLQFGGIWVAEYAREYLAQQEGNYSRDDIRKIAIGQANAQAQARRQTTGNNYIFVDTDALVCKVWEIVKYGDCCAEIETLWQTSQAYFYILCSPDIAWQADPLREAPNDTTRWLLFEKYKQHLQEANRDFVIVSGNNTARLAQVADYLDKKANAPI